MSDIKMIIASIQSLHGDERSRAAKYDSFIAWQVRQRMAARGEEAPSSLKKSVDDPHDPIPTVRSPKGYLVPDYSKPGTAEKVRKEVDEIEEICWRKGRD